MPIQLENAKGIYEGQRATDPDKRVFILTRSAFAGSQHYGAAVWSGDIASRWEDMKAQMAAGINFSMSGIPYWTMDIGGFAVEQKKRTGAGKELRNGRNCKHAGTSSVPSVRCSGYMDNFLSAKYLMYPVKMIRLIKACCITTSCATG